MYNQPYHSADLSKFRFLVTGGAGFIGSNLVEYLLKYNANVRVLDNFSTGFRSNIEPFLSNPNFELLEGDICDIDTCEKAVQSIDFISHHAALGSVPRSINNPVATNAVNINGFLNILCAAKENTQVKRVVYAASSSTYGDSVELPKIEERIGRPLSPYAVTKYVNELYADVFGKIYGLDMIGLRYFNVFGPRQSPQGAYAAVIPLFIQSVREDVPAFINGNGENTRDFTFIENVVQANLRAFFANPPANSKRVYNIAFGQNISLNRLWQSINEIAGKNVQPEYRENREGDIKDSLADISKAKNELGYQPLFNLRQGLEKTMEAK